MHPVVIRTPEQIIAQRKYALANDLPEDIYESFLTFAKYMIPKWTKAQEDWIWAHEEICEGFQQIFDGEIDYLTIETPPQLGKTALSTLFIVYVFGSNPDTAQMYFTYNEVRATAVTKENIFTYMGSDKYKKVFPFVILKNDIDKSDHSSKTSMKKKQSTLADNRFNLINPLDEVDDTYRGRYSAFGLGQGAQGNPADIMHLDDYIAKGMNIKSENFRASLKGAFYDDIVSRFQPYSKFIITCTRWYEEDPIGLLHDAMIDILAEFEAQGLTPPRIRSIKIRAEYRSHDDNSTKDPRTKDGEWLWLPMLSKYLMAKKSDNYNAMYNCDPSDVDQQQQITKEDFGYYHPSELPSNAGRIFISMDGASTTKDRSDHTAIGAWLVLGRKRFLLKLWYVKLEVPKLFALMEKILTEEYPDYSIVLIEFANSGVPVYQHLTTECKFRNIIALGFSGKAINDNKGIIKSRKDISSKSNSKMERYLRMIPEFQIKDRRNGNRLFRIWLPEDPIEHQDILLRQLTKFNGADGNADDMVDMTSYFVNYTTSNIIVSTASSGTQLSANQLPENGMNYFNHNPSYFIGR